MTCGAKVRTFLNPAIQSANFPDLGKGYSIDCIVPKEEYLLKVNIPMETKYGYCTILHIDYPAGIVLNYSSDLLSC